MRPIFENRKAWELSLGGKIVVLSVGVFNRDLNPGLCPIKPVFADGRKDKVGVYPCLGSLHVQPGASSDLELTGWSNISLPDLDLLPKGDRFRLFCRQAGGIALHCLLVTFNGWPWSLEFREIDGQPRDLDYWCLQRQMGETKLSFGEWQKKADPAKPWAGPIRPPPVVSPDDQGRRFFGESHD